MSSMENYLLTSEVNIMLLGLTGSGKSATGNTIIGGHVKKFEEGFSASSVTRACTPEVTEVNGQKITVIDTVGLSDTHPKITDAQTKIENILRRTNLDVFLLVIKLGETFTEEKIKTVKWIQENFGSKVLKHTIVLFTCGDALTGEIEAYVSNCEDLSSVVVQCSGGYHVFNNRDDEDRSQVTELLKKIKKLRVQNQYSRYTEQDYSDAQEALLLQKVATGAAAGGGIGAVVGGAAGVGAGIGGAATGAVALGAAGAIVAATGGAALLAIGVFIFARKYKKNR